MIDTEDSIASFVSLKRKDKDENKCCDEEAIIVKKQ